MGKYPAIKILPAKFKQVYNSSIMISCKGCGVYQSNSKNIMDTTIKAYIKELSKENRDYMLALRQGFQDDIKKSAEMISAFATKTDVLEIVKEEIKPLETKIDLIISEIALINSEIGLMNGEIGLINKKLA